MKPWNGQRLSLATVSKQRVLNKAGEISAADLTGVELAIKVQLALAFG